MTSTTQDTTRRTFLKQSAAGVGAAAFASARLARAAGPDPIRVGLVGCGRRGAGAAKNCVDSAENVVITAIGDLFEDQLKSGREKLAMLGGAFQVKDDACYTGFDNYLGVIQRDDVDLVILAAPPGFRPLHLQAAVDAGKHVFMEKPAAVDPAGVRTIIQAADQARQKGLAIVAGTQRRHQAPYLDLVARIRDGAIGDVVSASCYWVGDYGYYPAVKRQAGWSDMEWQVRNWNYFAWLSGDHIVEQHVHNLDVISWVLGVPPVKAFGIGGRQQRVAPEFGHIFDHFSVEFEYANGLRVQSLCRQQDAPFSRVGEWFVGTKGTADPRRRITAESSYEFAGQETDPYVQEHTDLIASIRAGEPLNEGRAVAESTMMAIMGRMACYTGAEVTWDWAMNESRESLVPDTFAFGPLPVPLIAVPGITQLV